MNDQTPIIIDTDPGVDDALAIIYAIMSKLPIKGLTSIYGNASVASTTKNCSAILNLLDQTDIPIYKGSSKPLYKNKKLAECHGEKGLGLLKIPKSKATISNKRASHFITETIKKRKVTIVGLGPLTNIAKAINDSKDTSNIDRIILLGGTFDGIGNISPYAEFNTYNDPDALKIILNSNSKTIVIPANICRKVTISLNEFKKTLKNERVGDSLRLLVTNYIYYYQNNKVYGGYSGGVMYDILAIAYVLTPKLFTLKAACVTVNTSNTKKRGETKIQKKLKPNCLVVTNIQADKIKQNFLNTL
jgi:inosine-uridine nucleoside N-ribohydrolase